MYLDRERRVVSCEVESWKKYPFKKKLKEKHNLFEVKIREKYIILG